MSIATLFGMTKMAAGVAILLCCIAQARSQSIISPERSGGGPPSTRPLSPAPTPPESGAARVYLLHGWMNVFSLGMDDLAQKLERNGIPSSVRNHAEWQQLAEEIAARYRAGDRRPIILIGHSLGADAALLMGEHLGRLGVPVALIVLFDGTQPMAVTENVARVMNITQRVYITGGPGFRGELINFDVSRDASIAHTTIDKSARLHAVVIDKIKSVIGQEEAVGQPSAPAASMPADAPRAEPGSAAPKLGPPTGPIIENSPGPPRR
jgi:pimeloyl-ACP methyl ester carboxylesterase